LNKTHATKANPKPLPLIAKTENSMKKKYISISILIGSLILLFANIFTFKEYDAGFYMRIIANLFIIFAMIMRIISENKSSESNR